MARVREGDAGRDNGHPLLLAYVIIAHVLILTVVFWTIYKTTNSDIPIYYRYASQIVGGAVPYRDFPAEYPPGALLFFTLPRLVGHAITPYYAAFRVQLVVFDLMGVVALNALARRRGLNRTAVLGAYTIFTLTVGPIIGEEFDLIPAVAVLCALLFADREEWEAAGAMLGLGIVTKLYPALLVPVFAIPHLRRRDYGPIVRAAAFGIGAVAVAMAPLVVVTPGHVLDFLRYHAARGIHLESTYGSVLVALTKLHLADVWPLFNFGSWNLSGYAADVVKPFTTIALAAALIAAYVAMYRATPAGDRDDSADLANWSAIVLLVGLIASKVLSPQYLIWLMPVLPLIAGRTRRAVWILFGVIGGVTYYIFPLRYMALVSHQDADVVAALVLRNALLVAMAILLWRGLLERDVRSAEMNQDENG